MTILSMAMSSKKRMKIIVSATPKQYFQMLDEQKKMSRNERSALAMQGRLLKTDAIEDEKLRAAWNKAAAETGHGDQMFHVSIG